MFSKRPDVPLDPARSVLGAHPDPPPRGIIVRVLRGLARVGMYVFVIILDAGRRFGALILQTEYKIAGGCDKRGACCHHVLLEWSTLFDRFPILGRIVLWKYTRLYSFFDRGYTWEIQPGLMTRVLGCHAVQEDGSCGEYRMRPLICRAFPELPLTGKPLLLNGCGYRFERRDGRPEPKLEPGENLVSLGGLSRRLPPDS
jgi:hypothetical protein